MKVMAFVVFVVFAVGVDPARAGLVGGQFFQFGLDVVGVDAGGNPPSIPSIVSVAESYQREYSNCAYHLGIPRQRACVPEAGDFV